MTLNLYRIGRPSLDASGSSDTTRTISLASAVPPTATPTCVEGVLQHEVYNTARGRTFVASTGAAVSLLACAGGEASCGVLNTLVNTRVARSQSLGRP